MSAGDLDDKINEIASSIPENLDEPTSAWASFVRGAFRGFRANKTEVTRRGLTNWKLKTT